MFYIAIALQAYNDDNTLRTLGGILRYQTVFDALENPSVLKDLQVLGFCQEQLIRILLRTHHACSRILHAHLL